MNNRVKDKIRGGELALGTYVSFTDPQIVEIIGLAGFDAAFIDMEHTAFDLPLIQQMIVAADLVGITPMVRVPDNDAKLILRILDMGGAGDYHTSRQWSPGGERGHRRRPVSTNRRTGRGGRHPGRKIWHRVMGRTR